MTPENTNAITKFRLGDRLLKYCVEKLWVRVISQQEVRVKSEQRPATKPFGVGKFAVYSPVMFVIVAPVGMTTLEVKVTVEGMLLYTVTLLAGLAVYVAVPLR